ncbi:helix-turn-helix transcriptional regulator [Salinigranum salinum]|uniref:helix-turn-helix transcriptional regulator n=1 Tax=Salinigranum salinum TaxID=1364937 RepID=UPI00126138F2|nr:helix-turn-helix domain-containing protein [Salinigranum salinum]
MNRGEPEDVLETISHRREFLALLADEPLDKASMVRRMNVSRSTVNRAITTLESHGLVERVDGAYATTTTGILAHRHLRETLSVVEGLMDARPLLADAGDAVRDDLPLSLFRDATVVGADDDRHGPVRFLVDLLVGARTIRSVGAVFRNDVPTSIRERVVNEVELRMTFVISSETLDWARTYHEPELRATVAADEHDLWVTDDPLRTTVAVVDTGTEETVTVVFYDDAGEPIGLVNTADPACLVWARERIDRVLATATPIDAIVDLD